MKYLILIGIIGLLLSGCQSTEFGDCYIYCRYNEYSKINFSCEYSHTEKVYKECGISTKDIIKIRDNCFDTCLARNISLLRY